MKNSLVLLVNLTPTCTELARHLVLSGINIWLLDGSAEGTSAHMINEEDTESDFLFGAADISRERSEVIKSKLSEMNPFVEIEFFDRGSNTLEQIFSKAQQKSRVISAVIQGFDTWGNAL